MAFSTEPWHVQEREERPVATWTMTCTCGYTQERQVFSDPVYIHCPLCGANWKMTLIPMPS